MTADTHAADTLRKNALGAPHIVFFVIAAAAPLTAVVGVTPAAFQLGNGPGVPGTFLLVGGLYLLFAAGFTAMSGFVLRRHLHRLRRAWYTEPAFSRWSSLANRRAAIRKANARDDDLLVLMCALQRGGRTR